MLPALPEKQFVARVSDLGQGLEAAKRACGLGFRVWGLGFRV